MGEDGIMSWPPCSPGMPEHGNFRCPRRCGNANQHHQLQFLPGHYTHLLVHVSLDQYGSFDVRIGLPVNARQVLSPPSNSTSCPKAMHHEFMEQSHTSEQVIYHEAMISMV